MQLTEKKKKTQKDRSIYNLNRLEGNSLVYGISIL